MWGGYHSYSDIATIAMIESVEGLNIGRKRRALSSACTFFHGLALLAVGSYYVWSPVESLNIIATAWGVDIVPDSSPSYVLARNLVMTAAVYLAVWGATAMCLATVAPPRTKKLLAVFNLSAALLVAVLSAFHPEAYAAASCRIDVDQAIQCLKISLKWHTAFIVLDVIAIFFAEAGSKLVKINDNTHVLLNSTNRDQDIPTSNYTIKKINSHADLIKYKSAPEQEGDGK